MVTLREPAAADAAPLADLLSVPDASRFGHDGPLSLADVAALVDRARNERVCGRSFTYVITLSSTRAVVGLIQVRQLDPAFEAAEWECTVAPEFRGTGVFLDAARLVAPFAFGPVGAHRLEARVLLHNGRASGALLKLGAVQEGILRRSIRRHGVYFDQLLWSILRDDWTGGQAPEQPRVH